MIGSMSGSIVNVPQPQAPYNAAKAAVRHLAASLAVEWAGHGIRVNCISPGYMLTALWVPPTRITTSIWVSKSLEEIVANFAFVIQNSQDPRREPPASRPVDLSHPRRQDGYTGRPDGCRDLPAQRCLQVHYWSRSPRWRRLYRNLSMLSARYLMSLCDTLIAWY